MNRKGIVKYVVFSAIGLTTLIIGLVLAIIIPNAQNIMRTLPFICVGIGSGIFGGNLGAAIKHHFMQKNPKMARQIEIDTKDERNVEINNKAKAKAYDMMMMVFSALILAFALMQVEVYVVLACTAAYLFIVLTNFYYLGKYQNEM